MITFQYYPSKVWIQEPLGTVDLYTFLNSIKSPKENIKQTFLDIQKATENGDLKRKDFLKQNKLYYVTPSVITNGYGRKIEDIIEYNPIMIVEFDKITFAEELKQYLFNKMSCIVAAYKSPSGRGSKFVVRIPKPKSLEEYKEYFCGMAYYLSQISGFDASNFNAILPHFITWDENILIRDWEKTTEWDIRGGKINSFKEFVGEFEHLEDVSQDDKDEIFNVIDNTFLKIEREQTAHRTLLGLSLWCGGLAGAGYLTVDELQDYLHYKVDECHYCQKGKNGYKKTTTDFLHKGTNSPLKLEKNGNKNKKRVV